MRILAFGAMARRHHLMANSSEQATAPQSAEISIYITAVSPDHLSDQYGYFSILPISPTESEAAFVLDGLFDQDTILEIQEHFTDTGGASDHVFGLFALIGKRFAPRLRNLKDRKFHTFEKGDAFPALSNHIGAPINSTLILDHWDDLLHRAASITTRSVVPSTILKKLSASPKESQLARALRELGRGLSS
jgi:TnpA family transposase